MPGINNNVNNRPPALSMGGGLNQSLTDTPTPGWWNSIDASNPVYHANPISNWQDQARDLLGAIQQHGDPNLGHSLGDILQNLDKMDNMNVQKYRLGHLMWMLHQNQLIRNPNIPLSPYGQWM